MVWGQTPFLQCQHNGLTCLFYPVFAVLLNRLLDPLRQQLCLAFAKGALLPHWRTLIHQNPCTQLDSQVLWPLPLLLLLRLLYLCGQLSKRMPLRLLPLLVWFQECLARLDVAFEPMPA